MARTRSPDRDKAYKIWSAADGAKKLTEIAQELGVSDVQIRKWKNQDRWEDKLNGNVTNGKSNVTINKSRKAKLIKKVVDSVEANGELTEKQRLFCIYYTSNNNATQSYLKAYDSSYVVAMTNGCRLLGNAKVKAEIKQLKALMRAELDIDITDMLNYCLRVVGADIGDYVKFGTKEVVSRNDDGAEQIDQYSYAQFSDSAKVDTSIIDEVKDGKSGVSIKLADKKWAWEQLAKYFDWLPDKHKRQIEEAKVAIARDKVNTPEVPTEPLILQPIYGKPPDEDLGDE